MSDVQIETSVGPVTGKASGAFKPKRTRKAKVAKVEKPKRASPRTLASWLRAKGWHYGQAAKVLGPAFRVELRAAIKSDERLRKCDAAVESATNRLVAARDDQARAISDSLKTAVVFEKLSSLAGAIEIATVVPKDDDSGAPRAE